MTWPEPTRSDHNKFCEVEGWELVRDARGRAVSHHVTYELNLPDGRILRTRVSRPVNRDGYGPSLWKYILRDQLDVDEAEFWSCVRDGVIPSRGGIEPPPEAIPAQLVHLLISQVGIPEVEVMRMTKEQAIERANRYWTEGE
ncbi:hypothetical protein [Lentzea aerocolonigenes]|uniref:hypothetical protein n=1 Tax=Lentzea aerocolonigenes TaxID=68170 RepID=UPI0004C44042|nr:hypothetical protein [Lentzea aerocolonigenes]